MRFEFQSTCRKTTEGTFVFVLQCIQNGLKIKQGAKKKKEKKKTALATCEAHENKSN